ncbi:MAG: class I SAM-dependent methyltransferase [Chloroflexota bacterium]
MLRSFYRGLRAFIKRMPGGVWLLSWTDPHIISHRLLAQAMAQRATFAHGWMLDIGCGSKPYIHLFGHVKRYIGIDLPSPSPIDIYASGLELPFCSSSFDTLLCNEVLEHVPEPSTLISEAARILKPGGYLILTTPQTWGLHLEPYDFYRYTPYGLRYLATKHGLEVIEVVPTSGLWATWMQRFSDTVIFNYLRDQSPILKLIVSLALAPFLFLYYYLDKLFGKRGDSLDNVLVARKPASSSEHTR